MPSRIQALLERQAVDYALLQDHEVALIVLALEDARREILAELGAGRKPPTVHQLHVMQAQVEAGILRLQDRMERTLQSSERVMRETALQHLIQVVDAAEATFRDHGAEIEVNILRRLTRPGGLALHRHSIARYGSVVADAVQREMAVSYARGQTQFEIAQRVAGVDGVIARHRGRAELITRMETAHAYDEGHQVALEETAAFDAPDTKDPLMKRADEFLDSRNHPFSRLLDGKAVLPGEAWEVPVSGAAERGLVWTVTNGVARGTNYPAHFNDRGRQTPWRKSWGESAAPQPARKARRQRRREPPEEGRAEPVRVQEAGERPSDFRIPDPESGS